MKHFIKITLIKSIIGRLSSHKSTVMCLGLKKINSSIILENNLSVSGMIKKINYLVKIEIVS